MDPLRETERSTWWIRIMGQEDSAGDPHLRARATHVVQLAIGAGALVLTFELLLSLAAVALFPHLDTPLCAATDTFCAPEGHAGPTGGAVVFWTGNAAAACIAEAGAFRARARARARSRFRRTS